MKHELRRVTVSSAGAENARQRWAERQSLLLRLSDAQGLSGVGEASPLPGYSPDGLDDVEAALAGLDSDGLASAVETGDIRAALTAAGALAPRALPSARMALETAMLDYVGQRERRSAPALLGAEPGAERPLAELIGSPLDPDFSARCERAVCAGFRDLKVKLGAPRQLDAELSALAASAARLGRAVSFRVDANQALDSAEVERAWAALRELGIELFEEPGASSAAPLAGLPLALDESLQGLDVDAALERLGASSARFAVLKPTALGGLAHCWALAERAQKLAVRSVVSHCFDGPLALRAAAALALALPGDVAHGLAPHAALTGWQEPNPPVERGWLKTWSEPGLGLPAGSAFE